MKLKRSRKQRSCSECNSPIQKGELYGQRWKTITDKEGQSFNGGKTWIPLTLRHKLDICKECSNG